MEIIKVISVAIVGALIFSYLKTTNSELSGIVAVAVGIIIVISVIEYLTKTVAFFVEITKRTGLSSDSFVTIVKVIAVSYLADFCESLCTDLGVKSIGDKVNFASRIIIFTLAIPVFINLYEIVSSLIV